MISADTLEYSAYIESGIVEPSYVPLRPSIRPNTKLKQEIPSNVKRGNEGPFCLSKSVRVQKSLVLGYHTSKKPRLENEMNDGRDIWQPITDPGKVSVSSFPS